MKKAIAIILCSVSLCFAFLSSGLSLEEAAAATPYETYKDHPYLNLYEYGNIPYNETCLVAGKTMGTSNAETQKLLQSQTAETRTIADLSDVIYITPYLAEKPNGAAVVVFSGGAYKRTDNYYDNRGVQAECSDIATVAYNAAGVSVFVVNYRTKETASGSNYKGLMSDGLRAVRYVRYHAADFGINPDKIAVMGFSAGGHLAAELCLNYDWNETDPNYKADEIDKVSAKPNAGFLSYAVLSLKSGLTHNSTKNNFLGSDTAKAEEFSAENQVTSSTPPLFLWCNALDSAVPPEGDMTFCRELEKNGVSYELHIFNLNDSTHDPGAGQSYLNCATWPTLSLEFMKQINFL